MIMDYLREHNMIGSLFQVEKEANVQLYKYSKELSFLQNLVLEGQWEDLESFVLSIFDNCAIFGAENTHNSMAGDAHAQKQQYLNRISYLIKKQIYLELLLANDLENNQNFVVELVKEMELLSPSKQEHIELCNLLNYARIQNHPSYAVWNVSLGRFETFNAIKSIIGESQVLSPLHQEGQMGPSSRNF